MKSSQMSPSQRPLLLELARFTRLRWIAGGVVLVGGLVDRQWLGWYAAASWIALVGLSILIYNLGLILVPWRWKETLKGRDTLLALAWSHLLLDLACLTFLVLLTGGLKSPLLGFFTFHMVFASLLLPRSMAFAGASLAMLMLAMGLWATAQWPDELAERLRMVGWMLMLLMIVWLTNGITRALRRQRRRLVDQNRRIRGMSRTLRRQQQGMIQQEKMAAAGRMAAGVAHEIANPLASMDGLLQLMERRPEKLRPEALGTLREQINRINQIVRRMTTFAHPGDGQWQMASLNEVAEKALEVVQFDPRLKRVAVERHLGADLPAVRMLTDAMQQVIINLVINAVDAMEETAHPRLIVRSRVCGEECHLEIVDNGPGIDPEHRKRLFEPFFTTKPPGKGTGLGLSISYTLIRTHGGRILVDSPPGQGACFSVCLPCPASLRSQTREPLGRGNCCF